MAWLCVWPAWLSFLSLGEQRWATAISLAGVSGTRSEGVDLKLLQQSHGDSSPSVKFNRALRIQQAAKVPALWIRLYPDVFVADGETGRR